MDQFTHMQHDNVLSSRQKPVAPKISLEAIFVVFRSDSIKKTAKENSFHINLTWVYEFMKQEYSLKSQYLQFNVTQVVFYDVNYLLTSLSFKSPFQIRPELLD